jgi:hypothetical protein
MDCEPVGAAEAGADGEPAGAAREAFLSEFVGRPCGGPDGAERSFKEARF